jgi:hypothetical protein
MEFSSVNEFLRKAASAKADNRTAIDDALVPYLDDPSVVGVSKEVAESIDELFFSYGDEAFRQIALFCLGKWLNVHGERVEDHAKTESWPEALHTMNDIGRLSAAMQTIEQIASFSGDCDWRKMLRDIVGQSVVESLEERDPDTERFVSILLGEQ